MRCEINQVITYSEPYVWQSICIIQESSTIHLFNGRVRHISTLAYKSRHFEGQVMTRLLCGRCVQLNLTWSCMTTPPCIELLQIDPAHNLVYVYPNKVPATPPSSTFLTLRMMSIAGSSPRSWAAIPGEYHGVEHFCCIRPHIHIHSPFNQFESIGHSYLL